MLWKRALVLVIACCFVSLLSACAKKEALPEDKKSYAGRWVADDGTFVQIYLDGGGDFKTSNSNVSGGNTTFKDNTLHIGLGPIDKAFVITEGPKEGPDGVWILTLDGNAYTKSKNPPANNLSTDTSSTSTGTSTEEAK